MIDGDDDDNNDVINDVDDKHLNTFPFIHYYFIFWILHSYFSCNLKNQSLLHSLPTLFFENMI